MHLILILLTVFLYQRTDAQLTTRVTWTEQSTLPANEVIYYSPEKNLKWSDFKGAPVDSRAAAVTVSGFGYKADINTRNGRGQLNISVYCYFNKNKSWVKNGRTTQYILTHEQRHFDISYIAARVFADKLEKANFTSSNYNSLLTKINNVDMLVIGAHGHTGMKDFIYGATVNSVRHELKIPVLVVTL